MTTKYENVQITPKDFNKSISRLTNQIWKLIPMKENNENWQKQLNTVLIEVVGLNEIFQQNKYFLEIISKMEGLNKQTDIDFFLYRKTVFDLISLIQRSKQNEE